MNPRRVDFVVDLAYGLMIFLSIVFMLVVGTQVGIAFGLGVLVSYAIHVVWKMARFDPEWMTREVSKAVEETVSKEVSETVEETVSKEVSETVEETVTEEVSETVAETVTREVDDVKDQLEEVNERVDRRPRVEEVEETVGETIKTEIEPEDEDDA